MCAMEKRVYGTRLMVSVVLDHLAVDEPVERILKNYPTLKAVDIQAALQYAAEEF